MTEYIVWNEAHTQGFATTDHQLAYEARKGSIDNCYDENGNVSKLAQLFCELTSEEPCTIEVVEESQVLE